MLLNLKKIKTRLYDRNYSYLLPFFYLLSLIISFVVSLSSLIYPVSFCPSFFGERVCAPVGAYLALFASVPGYIVIGALNFLFGGFVWYISLVLVIVMSFVFYFLAGKLVDRYKAASTVNKNEVLVAIVFLMLLMAFLFFYFKS